MDTAAALAQVIGTALVIAATWVLLGMWSGLLLVGLLLILGGLGLEQRGRTPTR